MYRLEGDNGEIKRDSQVFNVVGDASVDMVSSLLSHPGVMNSFVHLKTDANIQCGWQ
jgi:hypothetical protein